MAYYNFMAEGSTGASAYYLGTLTSGSSMNISSRYPDYANLTSANFLIVPQTKSLSAYATAVYSIYETDWSWTERDENTAAYSAPSVSYNPSTGVLSFSSTVTVGGHGYGYDYYNPGPTWAHTYPSASSGLTAKVYLVPTIENL